MEIAATVMVPEAYSDEVEPAEVPDSAAIVDNIVAVAAGAAAKLVAGQCFGWGIAHVRAAVAEAGVALAAEAEAGTDAADC